MPVGHESGHGTDNVVVSPFRAAEAAEGAKWFRKGADLGSSRCQIYLGMQYQNGWGVAHDDAEAVRLFRKAAEQKDGEGEYLVATCYADGRGVAKDDKEAVKWAERSASHGSTEGEFILGFMYETGFGVDKNLETAKHWYKLAAELNYMPAIHRLKELNETPPEVNKSAVEQKQNDGF